MILDIGLGLLVDGVIGQMHKPLLQTGLRSRIGHGCQSDQAILEHVNLERIEADHQDVDSEVIFVASDQVGFADVFGYYIAVALVDGLFLAYDADTPATTRRNRLYYEHVLEVVHLSVDAPAFVVFGHDVSRWTDIEGLAVESFHALHISPHIVLPADCPRASKMVNVLTRIQILESALFEEASPGYVPIRTRHVTEAGHFKRVDYTVVGVCGPTPLLFADDSTTAAQACWTAGKHCAQ